MLEISPTRRSLLRLSGALLVAPVPIVLADTGSPAIQIDHPTRYGGGPDDWDSMSGTALAPPGFSAKVILYAETNQLYIQPWPGASVGIDPNGKWASKSRRGFYNVALLVLPSHEAPAILRVVPTVGGTILAVHRVPARQS
jgi:hypothetical protein